ncbi:FISUMP domain-containing protein [Robertkochia flava]|uniref:FISUMP domain-containing protein n=1 Tax=Robertkochia flava TaxID=3447986 RepID=UPI001CCFF582|nr:FISUMP domain-containing protein [Robertkochia marina]
MKNYKMIFNNRKGEAITAVILLLFVSFFQACSPDDEEVQKLNPNAGPGFENIENDGYGVQLNAVPVKPPLVGTWRIYIGENGRFEDIHDPRTMFYGEPGESYQLGWEVSEGDRYEAATITVSFKAMNPVIISPAKETDTLKNNISYYLEAEAPKFGATGKWEIVNSIGGRIENQEHHKAEFIGEEKSNYSLRWTLSYGSKKVSEEVSFITDVLRADAGPDRLDIKTAKYEADKFYGLEAYLPAGATGEWTLLENNASGYIYNSDNPNTLIRGVADSIYSLLWKVDVDGHAATDTVKIRFRGKWGMFKDPRDNQVYRFTEINGLEWMADNYNYAAAPGNGSWYYGHAYRAIIGDGYALETQEDRKRYGRLYTYHTARDFAPEGWRLPTGEEYQALIVSQGGALYAKPKLITGGETGLEINYPGYLEFSSSQDPAFRNVFTEQDGTGMFWTMDYYEANNTALGLLIRDSQYDANVVVIAGSFYALPVRYVREVQK